MMDIDNAGTTNRSMRKKLQARLAPKFEHIMLIFHFRSYLPATMSSAIIVIDDSSDDEAPPPRSTLTAASIAAEASAIAAAASANKRQRTDPTGTSTSSTSTPPELPAIITPSFTGAAAASASAAANGASAAAATKSPRAATSAKKRPSPTLGDEARKLDHALERAGAGASSGTSKSSEEEAVVEITDPRATIVDILGSCHAKVSFGAGRGPMPAEATMGLPGLSVKGVGPVREIMYVI